MTLNPVGLYNFNYSYPYNYMYGYNIPYQYNQPVFTSSPTPQNSNESVKPKVSTGTKVAIGAGIATALAIGADFVFCKGKHVKSIFGKTGNKGGSGTGKPSANQTNTTSSNTSAPVRTGATGTTGTQASNQAKTPNIQTAQQLVHTVPKAVSASNPTVFNGKSPVNISDYTPVQQRAREFSMRESLVFSHGKPDNMYLTNLSPETIYRNAVKLKYNNIRSANYKINGRYNQNIDRITGATTSEITVTNQNNWNYRIPKTITLKDKAIDRISLNVYPDEQLITLLDKYFATGKVKGYYKTPDRLGDWGLRHDPITIYLQEPVNQSIIDDVVKISKPHIRSTENVLIGKTVSPGVALDKSPSTQDLINLIQEARQYDEILAHQLETSKAYGFAHNPQYGDYTLQSSAGQVAAVRALLDDMAKAV